MKRLTQIKIITAFMLAIALAAPSYAVAQDLTARVSPDNVGIGVTYSGETLKIYGSLPENSDVIIKVTSDNKDFTLSEVSRKGPFWINGSDITIKQAPGFYKLSSSKPVEQLLPAATRQSSNLGLDVVSQSLVSQSKLDNPTLVSTSDGQTGGTVYDEFMRLKNDEGRYSQDSNARIFDAKLFETSIDWPSSVTPGAYRVDVFAVRDGAIIEQYNSSVEFTEVGATNWVSELAHSNGALYGLFACVVAIISGFLVGKIFQWTFRTKASAAH